MAIKIIAVKEQLFILIILLLLPLLLWFAHKFRPADADPMGARRVPPARARAVASLAE